MYTYFSRPNLETLLQSRLQSEVRELLPRVETLRAERARLRGYGGHPDQVRVPVVAPLRRPEVGGGLDYTFQTLKRGHHSCFQNRKTGDAESKSVILLNTARLHQMH